MSPQPRIDRLALEGSPVRPPLREACERAGLRRGRIASLPLTPGDVTVASETELQAAVVGDGRDVDLLALVAIPVAVVALALLPEGPSPRADVGAGLAALWHPGVILCLEAVWVGGFLFSGVSQVTGSLVSFRVYRSRI